MKCPLLAPRRRADPPRWSTLATMAPPRDDGPDASEVAEFLARHQGALAKVVPDALSPKRSRGGFIKSATEQLATTTGGPLAGAVERAGGVKMALPSQCRDTDARQDHQRTEGAEGQGANLPESRDGSGQGSPS